MDRGSYLLAQLEWPGGTRTESFGFLLQVLARRMDADMKAQLEELGLEFRFFVSLMLLLAKDGQSQRELGNQQGFPEYHVSRTLDAMEKNALVERRPSPTSRRTTLIFLTSKGREMAEKLPAHIRSVNSSFLGALEPSECQELLRLMQKLHSAQAN